MQRNGDASEGHQQDHTSAIHTSPVLSGIIAKGSFEQDRDIDALRTWLVQDVFQCDSSDDIEAASLKGIFLPFDRDGIYARWNQHSSAACGIVTTFSVLLHRTKTSVCLLLAPKIKALGIYHVLTS